ncbi:long-chain fatty acid--CoA ligase [Pyxidicoccus sp. MSG2]|uniref:long-chain fatty acid--CoA ligase n=1 Tax=Pyxidicoccus sp. MSG2 TaxID=2996790 RepID=UPI002270D75E|nr:long-chain fatty acid--CoA ligase [Pyxidicoccus sp. MSG2]MCY1022811.1 long-chain fatty acid--CoA ligase [Pyxidicoccus sp. MSG2]
MPFDLRDILRQLDADLPDWRQQSWTDSDGFAMALAAHHASRGAPAPKSRPGQHHDFFHDLVTRHADSGGVALRAWDPLRGWQTLGYRELQDRASRRAAEWASQGVKPGAKLCLLYGVGPELLVSLMAALKLGTCVSLLPPVGTHFLSRRLSKLAPAHVAAESHQAPLLKGFEPLLLRSRGDAAPAFTSHTYRPDEPVALLFSPLVDPTDTPVPLSAEAAWRGALCDGVLTFGLGPGDHLAAPGFHFLQHQPALLLATLLRGATFLHLEPADVERAPGLLTEHPLRALGVSPALRDALLRARSGPLRNVAHWFRSADEPLDWQAWRDWVRQCDLVAVPCSNVLVDASAGGAVLTSGRRVADLHTGIAPAPGRAWALRDLNMSGQEAAGDVGVFTLLPDKKRPPGYVVLTRGRGTFLFAGTRDARREGRVYPAAEVAAALADLTFCAGASVSIVPTGGTPGHHRHVLLVFTGAEAADVFEREAGPRRQEIRRRLELRLGAEHLPDRTELFPMYPRRTKDGRVDDAWCRSQYLTGALHRKSSDPMFQALTALRGRVLETADAPGDGIPSGAKS